MQQYPDFDSSLFNIHLVPGSSRAVISHEKLSKIQGSEDSFDGSQLEEKSGNSPAQNSIEPNKGFINFIVLLLILQIITVNIYFSNIWTSVLSQLTGRMVLPFTPLTVVFQDVQYYVDIPLVITFNSYKVMVAAGLIAVYITSY